MNSDKVETWHGIIMSPTWHVQKSREGYGKNWMHFVYKLDTLFRSIRVSDENSFVTKALHYFKFITTPDLLCVHYAPFRATSSTFNPFWHNLIFLMHLLICFELNDPEIGKHYKWTLKRLKLGMVSSFHPHGMCKKVEMVTAKTRCTSCTNWTLSFVVSGFRTKTHLLHRLFKILIPYYNSGLFMCSLCTIQRHVVNFQPFLT